MKESNKKLTEIENIVFEKKVKGGEQFDVFDKINKKINVLDVDRQRNESNLRKDLYSCLDKFEDYKFVFEQHDKTMRNIDENIIMISSNLHELKDHVNTENERLQSFMT